MYQSRRHRQLPFLAGMVLFVACATNPATGKREFNIVSESQEIAMGQEGAQAAAQTMGILPDSNIQRYVRQLGAKLAQSSERPNLPWSFTVVDDPLVNAFALPGGPVFITRGIMTFFNSEAELVGVLGHEIGHITARHSARQLSRQQLAQIGLVGAMIASPQLGQLAGLASEGLGLLFLKYGRDDETQADDLGFRYGLNAGYDVREMAATFRTLDRMAGGEEAGRPPEWQSTHPDPGNRAEKTLERAQASGVNFTGRTVNREEYLRRIDGLVYGENPRQGFFENDVFYHPDLKFQLRYPNGWPRQNATTSVVSVSPQKDAMLTLTAGRGAPQQALQEFLGQQGIQAGQISTQAINGYPAAAASFAVQTEQGQLAGIVAFIGSDAGTFRLMGYTPQAQFQTYQNLFRQWIGTFARLTDQRVLGVQPARVKITQVPRAMTISEFNRQYPSTIPVAELALINGLTDANGTLAAGSLVKRVEGGVSQR
jgi:predicted Zn-dependent protease